MMLLMIDVHSLIEMELLFIDAQESLRSGETDISYSWDFQVSK